MSKLRLDPDALRVESFAAIGTGAGAGTVRGHGGDSVWNPCEPQIPDDSINDCGGPQTNAGCGTVTAANTCSCGTGGTGTGGGTNTYGWNTCAGSTCDARYGWTCSQVFVPEEP